MATNEGNTSQEAAIQHTTNIKKDIAHGFVKGAKNAAEDILGGVAAGIKATEMAAGDQSIKNAPHPLEATQKAASALWNDFLHPAGDMNLENTPHPVDHIKSAAGAKFVELKIAGPAAAIIGAAELMGEQAVYLGVPGGEQRAALRMVEESAAKLAAHEAIESATKSALKRENPFKEALDRKDNHINMGSGLTIQELTQYNDWNKALAGKRADFYIKLFEEHPELAAAMHNIDPDMRRLPELILSPEHDHIIGIAPYQGYQAPRATYGYAALKAQAKQWGIEWKESTGVLDELKGGELAANKDFFDAKKAVEAAGKIELSLHQDAALRLINPDRAMAPELQALAAQILHAKLVDGALSLENRQALPKQLQNLPVTELAKLQAKTAASLPENLRLSVTPQTNALTADSANYAGSSVIAGDNGMHLADQASTQQQFNKLRVDFLQSVLQPAQQAPVAEIVRLSPQQVAVQQKMDAFITPPNAAQKAVNVVVGAVNSKMGNGYNFSALEKLAVESANAKSDYDGFVIAAQLTAHKGLGVLAMAGSAAAIGPVGPAAIAGAVLVKEALKQYELDKKIVQALQPTLDSAHAQLASLTSNATNHMGQAYQRLVQHLPKDTQGNLTQQGAQVLMEVDQNLVRSVVDSHTTPPIQLDGP